MLTDLQQTFGSLLKSLDVLDVIKGDKPLARVLCAQEDLEKFQTFFEQQELSVVRSDFKVLKEEHATSCYSDRSIKVPEDDKRQGHYFLYAGRDQALLEQAKQAEETQDHQRLGQLLGYPTCCTAFFEQTFKSQNEDLTLDVVDASEHQEHPIVNNIAGRHFDISYLTHFPCSFDCPASKELGEKRQALVRADTPKAAELFDEFLKGVVIYTDMLGVFFLKDVTVKENTIEFKRVLTTAQNKLYGLLEETKKIEIVDKNTIVVGDEQVGGAGFGVVQFT